jgi:hypothetical protein
LPFVGVDGSKQATSLSNSTSAVVVIAEMEKKID